MRAFILVTSLAVLTLLLGCTDPSGTNWGELNPVGVGIDVSRGNNSPGDTTVNLEIESGTSCGECTDEGGGVGKNCSSVPSGTPVDYTTCTQWGGFRECECN